MKQFSLKTNWRLAERHFTSKPVRKIHTELGREEREAIRSRLVLMGGDSEGKTDYMGRDPT